MGFLKKIKQRKNADADNDQGKASSETEWSGPDGEADEVSVSNEEGSEDTIFDIGSLSSGPELSSEDESDGEEQQDEKPQDDDDPLAGELMDIFTDEEEAGENDLSALSDYLEDIDMESLLMQAREVVNRFRDLQ